MLNRNLQQVVNQAMAATSQLPSDDEHVVKKDNVWWYWDVNRDSRWGPYPTREAAEAAFRAHQGKQVTAEASPVR